MKKIALVSIVAACLLAGGLIVDGNCQIQVCPEKDCYVVCPSGDISFCFCIMQDGVPMTLPVSQVYLKVECLATGLYICPGEVTDKPAYLMDEGCHIDPDCGNEYCWAFQMGGCCLEAKLSLHLEGNPVPFYEEYVVIKSPDINGDGAVTLVDYTIFGERYGSNDVCADLDCDGFVGDSDVAIFNVHYQHSCDVLIGTEDATWGSIKTIYTE